MSTTTPEILPYATPEGIKEYVPLQQHISVCAERDVLRHEVKHLRQAVAELNERMTTEVKSYMASMEALRAENRRLEKELSAARGQA